MDAGDGFPVLDPPDVDAGPHDVGEAPAQLLDRRLDLVKDEPGLGGRVARADRAVGTGGGRAGDEDAVPDADGARVAGEGLPGRPAIDGRASRSLIHTTPGGGRPGPFAVGPPPRVSRRASP